MAPEIVYILFSVTSEEHFYAIAPISLVIIRFIPSKQDDDDMEISTDFRTHTHTNVWGFFHLARNGTFLVIHFHM